MTDDIVEKIVMKGKAAEEIRRLREENEQLIKDLKTAVFADSAELKDIKKDNEHLREQNEKMKYFLQHNVFAEKQFGVYFVCGDSGDKDRNNMPKDIYVCPAYGSDIIYRYKRMDSSAPQW